MFLDDYYQNNSGTIHISRQQASHFAKYIAGDFNPIHDEDAKRFCVPGDLLFALVLKQYGLSQHMHFTFLGMVSDGVKLIFPDANAESITIRDSEGKDYLDIKREGASSSEPVLLQNLTRRYVEFSGQTFPLILVPLMAEQGVMINPERPLVIYESMTIDMQRLDINDPQLELCRSSLSVEGKRGSVCLEFCINADDEIVGSGKKTMVLSGLRAYDQAAIDQLVEAYGMRKEGYRL
ncbi:DUF3581 domain-containing protein [Sulfuriflexus sp.]|uniref:DUF3581 domain-containing protein n=1 Tax=Sulfuriflexus sp. TaxID=2015443 RepID=UPI0028CEDB2B|nr:DUF3581 domain-containing protein [Sulfuriflexus sp.]MDT8403215.1 DUF3581 domain-containing protein [Sulfuriflexus sp.]